MALASLESMGVSTPGMAFTTPVSTGMGAAGYASVAGLGIQVAQSYFGAKAAASEAKITQYKYEVDSKLAKMNSNKVALDLTRQFNNTMASNAVIAAAQGRSGGSVEAIGRAATAGYNWDMDFAELSRDIQTKGLDSMALGARQASVEYSKSAIPSMLGTALVGGTKLYSIGGSTRGDN